MRTRDEVSEASYAARRKWKDSGDPCWSVAEGVLAWVLEDVVHHQIEEVLGP